MHETALGYGPEELAGRHVSDWYFPENKEVAVRDAEELIKAGGGTLEASVLAKDGRLIPFFSRWPRLNPTADPISLGPGLSGRHPGAGLALWGSSAPRGSLPEPAG